MRYAHKISWLLFALLAADAVAQVGPYPGGQYPGGGYPPGRYPGGGYPGGGYPGGGVGGPGIPMPGRKGKKTSKQDEQNQNLQSVTGMLRALEDKQIIVEAQDTRIINIKRSAKTKFTKDGDDLKPDKLKPGDHLIVEYTQDQEGFFYAVNVLFQKEGTAAERADASRPVTASTQASQGGGGDPDDDPDRPRIRRADSGGGAGDSPAQHTAGESPAPPQPQTNQQTDQTKQQTKQPAATPPRGPEEWVAPPPDVASDKPLPPAPRDPDDPGPPTLRRGGPTPRKQAPRTEVASAKAPASTTAAPAPPAEPEPPPRLVVREPEAPVRPPTPAEVIIEKAKQAAESFSETLPNYICQEFMARFQNTSHVTSWQAIDVVSTEVVYENGRESYRNLAINGKPVKKSIEEVGGAWSTGEFGTLLRDLFSPATAAKFTYRRDSTIAGMSAAVFDFQVEREGSHWHVQVASQSILPPYKGSVWIDKKNGRVLRIEMQARNVPNEFPMDTIETAADYEYVRIGGTQQFLLPTHSETLMCQRGTKLCSRNAIDFRNYKKYSGEASITFDK